MKIAFYSGKNSKKHATRLIEHFFGHDLHHQYLHCEASYVPSHEEQIEVREKFSLPDSYVLVMGEADTMHGHTTILHAIFEQPHEMSVVIFGRRTTHSDVLLRVVRDFGVADRVQFIYECSAEDLLSIYRMALVMIYFPTFESSVRPIVEAMCQGIPMILTDTPLNRETAHTAAIFIKAYDVPSLVDALKSVLYNESFRGQLIAQCWAEARRYSDESEAEQLSKIYESV